VDLPGAAVVVPVDLVLLSGGCSDELFPIMEAMSLLLNVLLCSFLHLAVVVHDADAVPGPVTISNCSGASSLSSNALTRLCVAYKQQLLLQDPIRSFVTGWAVSHPLNLWTLTLFLTDNFFNYILCRSVMLLHNATIDLYKPTLREAPPHQWHHVSATPLLSSAGNQPTDDDSGSLSLRDLVVI
jgi:hypothetical protein